MRRIPSLEELAATGRAGLARFPETIAAGLLCAVAGLVVVGNRLGEPKPHVFELLASLSLSLPLTFAIAAASETGVIPLRMRRAALLLVVFLVAGVYAASFLLSGELFATDLALLSLASHLLAAFLPYLGRGSDDAFWGWNLGILARFLLSAIYSAVLYVGLAIAMATIQYLFSAKIPAETYARLWMLIAFGSNTWVFCAGIERPLPDGPVTLYPKPLRILTHYILIPLVTLYLLILYGYMVQIAIRREWPQGTVGWLVSAFSVLGMLALLFVHPIREASASRWVRTYARGFYVSLLPLVALLVLATWRRVSEYGLTEKRYLLLALGVWIAGVALHFTGRSRRDIRVIPASLCVLAVLASFGPWGAASVSRADQVARLRGLLERKGLLVHGKARPAQEPVDFATRKAISASLDYLTRVHRAVGVLPWFPSQAIARTGVPASGSIPSTAQMMAVLNVTYLAPWQARGMEGFNFYSDRGAMGDTLAAVGLGPGRAMLPISFSHYALSNTRRFAIALDRRFELSFDGTSVLRVRDASSSLGFEIAPLARRLARRYPPPSQVPASDPMRIEATGDSLEGTLVLWSLNGRVASDSTSVDSSSLDVQMIEGVLFLQER